jgi:vitamin K-dependent gamma-carboxylase
MVVAAGRFFWHDWIREYYLTPKYFFHYYGFSWVRPWPGNLMYVHYALMGAAALLLALGVAHRISAAAFCALFTYAHFIDKTNYLNHYYLVSCLSFLMVFLPLGRTVPAWALYLVRFQVAVVYVFGGIAKLKSDWLLHAEPLTIWLGANTDFPLLGRWFHTKAFAMAFSWAGAFFDLSVVPLLLWRRSRPFAYAGAVAFHLITARLFQLGMFPWIMMGAATVFFEPDWPRRFLPLRGAPSEARPLSRAQASLLGVYVAFQVLMPLRHWLYPSNVLWTEEGFRFAWNVMLMEKSGAVDMTVVEPSSGKRWTIDAHDYLTRYQIKMMSTQPDMILEFAHVVADDFAARGQAVSVHVDATVALNGRRGAPLVDPSVDLAREDEGFSHKRWLLPCPSAAPEM